MSVRGIDCASEGGYLLAIDLLASTFDLPDGVAACDGPLKQRREVMAIHATDGQQEIG